MAEIIKEEVELTKEANDIRKFVVGLLSDIRAKKDVAGIIAGNLQGLISAVEGYEKLPVEVRHPAFYNVSGLLAADITRVMVAPVVAPAVAAVEEAKAPEAEAPQAE